MSRRGRPISPLPSPANDDLDEGVERLPRLLAEAHRLWTAPDERRRVRAFGFRPAVEEGVLKREWHGLRVRVSEGSIRAALPGVGELFYQTEDGGIMLDGEAFTATPEGVRIVKGLLDLIHDYERWVEVREGREERIARTTRPGGRARQTPYNALAEARRVQRLLLPPRRGRRRRRTA